MLGLLDAKPHDIILLLDADEILSRTFLERLRRTGLERPHRLAMTRHYEYVDQLAPASPCCPPRSASFPFDAHRIRPGAWTELDERWSGRSGIAVRFCDLSGDESRVLPARSPYEFRRGAAHAPLIEDAGRHLSCVDRSARLERKLEWFPHLELADARARSLPFLALARQNGIHHHGWWYAEQPTGSLPDDLLRLSRNVPAMMRADPVPGSFRRRLVRTWAWLRFWPALPDGLVAAVDRHFGVLLPFLTPALLAADCLRVIAARFRWRWLSRLSAEPDIRGHG
jgi:beta-1,4-mannosyl-glycoprotein beta-1,4-N-acetylglucosaminyltransferase